MWTLPFFETTNLYIYIIFRTYFNGNEWRVFTKGRHLLLRVFSIFKLQQQSFNGIISFEQNLIQQKEANFEQNTELVLILSLFLFIWFIKVAISLTNDSYTLQLLYWFLSAVVLNLNSSQSRCFKQVYQASVRKQIYQYTENCLLIYNLSIYNNF